jgi:hypothetical protein
MHEVYGARTKTTLFAGTKKPQSVQGKDKDHTVCRTKNPHSVRSKNKGHIVVREKNPHSIQGKNKTTLFAGTKNPHSEQGKNKDHIDCSDKKSIRWPQTQATKEASHTEKKAAHGTGLKQTTSNREQLATLK